MKRILCFALAALLWIIHPRAVKAQEAPGLTGDAIGDILLTDLGIVGIGGLGITANFVLMGVLGGDGELDTAERSIASSMTELVDIPLFVLEGLDALPTAALGAGLLGAELLSSSLGGGNVALTDYFYWTKFDLTLYRTYSAYSLARLRSPAWDNAGFKRYTLGELYLAPLDLRNLSRPLFWAALGAGLGTFVLSLVVSSDYAGQAVWETGRWYVGNDEVDPGAFILANGLLKTSYAFTVGVGEEAFFRGVLYEEMSERFGSAWGKAIDSTAFAAVHLVTDVVRGMDWRYIIAHVIGVAANTFLLDSLYDEGGLPASVAAHTWIDFFSCNVDPFLYGGVPELQRKSANAALSLGMKFSF